jgi:hypothetical protein
MDSFAANYIKPRGSNLKNMNASLITNKRQAQMIFTGYERQINAINDGFKTYRGTTIFNGADGPTINNLKNGDTWTSPETLYAIKKTDYCTLSNSCPPPPPPSYFFTPSDSVTIQQITLNTIAPFQITYNPSTTNTGVIKLLFYDTSQNVIGTQIIDLTSSSLLITPSVGTTWNTIGYVFRSTPFIINPTVSNVGISLDPGYPYTFVNNTNYTNSLGLTYASGSPLVGPSVSAGNTYTPTPIYGYIEAVFWGISP